VLGQVNVCGPDNLCDDKCPGCHINFDTVSYQSAKHVAGGTLNAGLLRSKWQILLGADVAPLIGEPSWMWAHLTVLHRCHHTAARTLYMRHWLMKVSRLESFRLAGHHNGLDGNR
jgi:hypothetical protein